MYNLMAGDELFRVIINFLPIFGMAYLLMGLISDRNRDVPGGFLFLKHKRNSDLQ